jgi:predicted nucleic acid-binding protein
MVGLDTGFFIELMKKNKEAKQLWSNLGEHTDFPIVSVLTLGEILYFSYRVGKPVQGKKMVNGIETACNVKIVDQEITEKAAGLKHGRGMPYVDSLILATFMIAGCKELHTSDKNHFKNLGQKGLPVVFW